MRILASRAHRGPNRYALVPVVWLDVSPADTSLSCCHRLARWALALQREVGHAVRYARVEGRVGRAEVVFECRHPNVGLLAAETARTLVAQAHGEEEGAACETIARFLEEARRHCLGPSTASIVRAAEARGIPCARLGSGSLLRLGTGVHQRRVRATLTDRTSVIAAEIAGDKSLAHRMLSEAGLPVPIQHVVRDAEAAVAAARSIGGPVVVKPLDANHGRGVSIRIEGEEAVRRAFAEAFAVRRVVVVESFVEGDDHRLLVIDGRLVAAARRTPGHVVGDGTRTVQALVAELNRDPRRGSDHECALTRIVIDDEARRVMAEQSIDEETIVPAGQRVFLRRTANLSKGATAEDVTDRIHPDNRWLAERAARVVGLDVAGIDFITRDVSKSFRDGGGAICEVNAAPGFRMHVEPTTGAARDPAAAVVEMLFPEGTPATVPVTAITGTNGKTTTARMVASIHALRGRRVGLATTDGVYVNGELTVPGDMTGPFATETVLGDPTIDYAVLELARGGILREGLAIDACDVGAVLNVANDHLGRDGVESLDDMAEVKSIVARIARGTAVLNADDPMVAALAPRCERAERIAWVTMRPDNRRVRAHVQDGGLAAILERAPKGGTLTLYDGGLARPIAPAADLPAALGGIARHNVQNALFAAVTAYAGGASVEDIQRGLRGFAPSWEDNPGRLNVYRGHPFDVIMDYGHNPDGFRALAEVVGGVAAARRICVVGYPGNRRDADVVEAARALVPAFDLFVCRGEDDPRGRPADELPRMFERAFLDAGVAPEHISVVLDEAASIDYALSLAAPGDVVVIFAADLERTWRQIVGYRPHAAQVEENSWTARPSGS